MKTYFKKYGMLTASTVAGLAMALSVARCGSDTVTTFSYRQIERLARPAINEAFLRTNAGLNAFNSVAPSIDLTAAAASVVSEAKVTMKALYAGACFINGALTVALGGGAPQLVPGGVACQATGLAILGAGAVGLSAAFDTAAQGYADRVGGQFLPDVMRIDTTIASGYNALLCNAAATGAPLLCGGRKLDDPVADITYAYLLNGEAAPSVVSSIRNGAYYSPTTADNTCTVVGNANACLNPAAPSSRQGHKAVSYAAMPWSPAPY